MSIFYISFVTLCYLYNSCIVVTNSLIQVIDQKVPKSPLLGNYSDLIVDIGEDLLLECDQTSDTKSFEWYRNEENWFDQQLSVQRIYYNQKYLFINENKVSTVLYKCISRQYSGIDLIKSYKLYVDRLPKRRRDIQKRCLPPKCKPYATVWQAMCERVVLNLTYQSTKSSHGYNSSTRVWGNVLCTDEIDGFQIWVVGYGILKRFLQNDVIAIEGLTPGKSYCFNGWAYNSCGAGPVFTLEGVCAENSLECQTYSTEHCEYDFDYRFD